MKLKRNLRIVRAIAYGETSKKKLMPLARGSLRQKTNEFEYALPGKLSEENRFLLRKILSKIDFLGEELKKLDEEIFLQMMPYERQWRLLQMISGIDELSAALLIAKIGGNVKGLKNGENFSSWMGLCPSNNMSAGKKSLYVSEKRMPM